MEFIRNDGGRAAAGYKGTTGDCVVRAIAIATGLPYAEVYNALHAAQKELAEVGRCRVARKLRGGASPRKGVFRKAYEPYLLARGYRWVPCMQIGSGCKVHLRADELPPGRLIVALSKHLVAVIDGVLHDLSDCSRDGTRCVYGYYTKD